jgi:hypothetical protein
MSDEDINKVQEEEQEENVKETKKILKKDDIRLSNIDLSANKRQIS